MKLIFLIFITFFISQFQGSAKTKHEQLREYFQKVHQAAVAVCKGDMEVAKHLYNSAIINAPKTYSIDLNNAIYAEVNSTKPDTARILFYLQQTQKKGQCVHEKYADLPKVRPYTELIQETDCRMVISNSDRLLLKEIMVSDQAMRDSMIKYPNSLEMSRMLYAVDSTNYKIVSGILDRALLQNIPLENYVGVRGRGQASVIIVHYSEQRFDESKIFKLVEEGILDPRDVSVLFDESIERGYIPNLTKFQECKGFQPFGTTTTIQTLDEIFIKIPPDNCLSEINKLRKKYYLSDIIEECKIKAYAQYNHINGFSYRHTNLLLGKQSLQDLEKGLMAKYKIIKYKDGNDYDFNRGTN